jgi:hypothetical protein
MSEPLYNLGVMLSQQFGLADNQNDSLSSVDSDGNIKQYGKLGQFSDKFDHTAERRYVEEGSDRRTRLPKQLEILTQAPELTVFIKKKQFSSLKHNNKFELFDKDELLFLKASNVLLQNKCAQISSYEKLSKIEKIAQAANSVDSALFPLIVDSADIASTLGVNFSPKFKSAVDKVRKILSFNSTAFITNWITDRSSTQKNAFGDGTGVIELTNITDLQTQTTVEFGQGSCNFTVTDPYELMVVTNEDIERAISDTFRSSSRFLQFSEETLKTQVDLNKRELNDIRKARRVSPIEIIVDPEAFLGRRVYAILTNVGYEIKLDTDVFKNATDGIDFAAALIGQGNINIDASAKFGSDDLGNQGLKDNEISLLKTIVSSIFSLLDIRKNLKNRRIKENQNTNSVRRKLRLHYAGQPIVQPMDVIHVYMGSKTRIDNKIIGGLQDSFTAYGAREQANQAIGNIKQGVQGLTGLFNPSKNQNDIEKEIYVGKDFPNALWYTLRNHFVVEKAGVHVFAGLVSGASESYGAGGAFSLRVSAQDNATYFSKSRINFNPSVDTYNGPLFDPLTPFKLEFDSLTGKGTTSKPVLLEANQNLAQLGVGKYKNGYFAGKPATENNIEQDSDINNFTDLQKVFYSPDGFVYKWKEGIASWVSLNGAYQNTHGAQRTSVPRQTDQAFAGQDIMNVLSLLISGVPYNFSTFYKTARQFDNIDSATSASYYKNLLSDLKNNNRMWGEFIPFKSVGTSPGLIAAFLNGQMSVINKNDELNDLLQQRAAALDYLSFKNIVNLSDQTKVEIASFNDEIAKRQQENATTVTGLKSLSPTFTMIGDDISIGNESSPTEAISGENEKEAHDRISKKTNFLTRRMSYNVRANQDQNLFIVDDSWDKDLDLQAFAQKLGSQITLFQSDYTSVFTQIQNVAKFLDLEVFANTQGHIQIRPKQYNKIPSSIFFKLIQLKEDHGIELFPKFIYDLYINQASSFIDDIAIIELKIRLLLTALGKTDDTSSAQFINGTDFGGVSQFAFLSDRQSGIIIDIPSITSTATADVEKVSGILTSVAPSIDAQAGIKFLFTIDAQAKATNEKSVESINRIFTESSGTLYEEMKRIMSLIESKTGVRPPAPIPSTDSTSLRVDRVSPTNVLKVTKEVAQLLSERQRLIKSASGTLKQVKEAADFKKDKSALRSASFPNLYPSKRIPDAIKHMIEDESYDDLGPGSGSRFIIKNIDIITYTVTVNSPETTAITINGTYEKGLVDPPVGLNAQDGNLISTAYAVDYDMWRMYGFLTQEQPPAVPFLSDPELQLAPYAVGLLNRNRRNILRATLNIRGNEYMQPGDVIYLEHRDLLFYVESVNHSFNYGREFSTQLTLTYGHNPGEYIPTPYDVVGRALYKNKENLSHVNYRQDTSFNEESIGAIFVPGLLPSTDVNGDSLFGGVSGKSNVDVIRNIMLAISPIINSSSYGPDPKIEIRYYSRDNSAITPTKKLATILQEYLTSGKIDGSIQNLINVSFSPFDSALVPDPIVVDVLDIETHKTPSRDAYFKARNFLLQFGSDLDNTSADKIVNTLINGVIDIWLIKE